MDFSAPEIRRIFVRGSCHGYVTEGLAPVESLAPLQGELDFEKCLVHFSKD